MSKPAEGNAHHDEPSKFTGVAIAFAICAVIGIGVPFAMGGLGDGVQQLSSRIALSAASIESQRNALIAMGVGAGFCVAALFGGIALGLHFLVVALAPPAAANP